MRREVLARRNDLPEKERLEKSKKIQERVFELEEFNLANTVMVYINFGSEVETKELIEKCLELGKKVAVPVTDFDEHNLDLVLFEDFEELEENRVGILEPPLETGREVNTKELDLIIVPGIVFDEKGNRIGFGKAYYDEFLHTLKKKVPLIGLAFKFQVVEEVPAEKHDVKMNKIVTEKKVISANA